ncbi:MAG: signal recognition particle protein [Oligoflexia bacterium]|nr:signal recognition particle protein [Oligoflexia bacterium]
MFDRLSEKISDAFKTIRGQGTISDSNIDETLQTIRTALLEADVNFKVVKSFASAVKEKALGTKVMKGVSAGEHFVKIVHDELTAVMGGEIAELDFKGDRFKVVLVVGLNGAGKTTFSGKLALYLRKNFKRDVILVPADTNRPAAKEQLMVLAKSIGVDHYDSDLSKGPRSVVLSAIESARAKGKNLVIIDTAGRLHVDNELMQELKEVKEVLSSYNPEVLLVVDAMTGQEAVSVAETFQKEIGVTGVVLSKVDSDARGGAALSVRSVTGVPIRYLSMGEKLKDLELFYPDRLAKRILDMGDVLTLVEKAQEVIDEKDAMKMMDKMQKNRFTIDDFWKQMNSISKLGSMTSILKMVPGMGGLLRQLGDISPAETELKKMGYIISSMTTAERENDQLLNMESRRNRIARGSGTTPKDVSDFLQKFRQMRQMMSGLMGMMKGGAGGGMNPFAGMMPGMGGGGAEGMPQDFPGTAGMPGMPPMKGFRQSPGQTGKIKKKGKKRGP